MPVFLYFIMVLLVSCDQQSSKEKSGRIQADTVRNIPQSTVTDSTPIPINKDEQAVNASLQSVPGNSFVVLNDKTARWIKDAFDYFIVPRRKSEPNYPYIAKGDFNGDGRTDTAAMVKDSSSSKYRLAILLAGEKILFWDEDIFDNAAINTLPRPGEVNGMDGDVDRVKTVKTTGDAIEVYYFEQSSFVIYWDKRSFKHIWTSD